MIHLRIFTEFMRFFFQRTLIPKEELEIDSSIPLMARLTLTEKKRWILYIARQRVLLGWFCRRGVCHYFLTKPRWLKSLVSADNRLAAGYLFSPASSRLCEMLKLIARNQWRRERRRYSKNFCEDIILIWRQKMLRCGSNNWRQQEYAAYNVKGPQW